MDTFEKILFILNPFLFIGAGIFWFYLSRLAKKRSLENPKWIWKVGRIMTIIFGSWQIIQGLFVFAVIIARLFYCPSIFSCE